MPYNYLLDKKVFNMCLNDFINFNYFTFKLRKSNNIDLKNSIIIFDEAHNVVNI